MENGTIFATYPSLRDRVVVVTCGATGIGEAIVEGFVCQGAKVCFLDMQDEPAAHLIERLGSSANIPAYHHCDLTDIAALPGKALSERIQRE